MNELSFIVETAYGYIEDKDSRLADFVGEDEFDRAMYYALSKLKKLIIFKEIIDYMHEKTHISEEKAFEKGKKITSDTFKDYITCEGYIAFIKEGKYRKHIGTMKNE